jgi:hypothetical protein
MTNTITVNITFSFKGETFTPSTQIDLDHLMETMSPEVELSQENILRPIYPLLASSIHIDTYSYAYEIMQAGSAHYSEPTGMTGEFLTEGQFDFQAFRQQWLDNKNVLIVQQIAQKYLSVSDLDAQPALKGALLEALAFGQRGD